MNGVQKFLLGLSRVNIFGLTREAYAQGDASGFARAMLMHPDCMKCEYHPMNRQQAQINAYYQRHKGSKFALYRKEMDQRKRFQTVDLMNTETTILPQTRGQA